MQNHLRQLTQVILYNVLNVTSLSHQGIDFFRR